MDYGYDTQGKRLRKVAPDEAAADKAIDKWKKGQAKYGEFWARLDPVERQSTVAVLTEIRAANMTLPRVWADHQRWRKDNANTCTTPKAYEDVVTRWKERKLGAHKDWKITPELVEKYMKTYAWKKFLICMPLGRGCCLAPSEKKKLRIFPLPRPAIRCLNRPAL